MQIPVIDFAIGRPRDALCAEVADALGNTGFMAIRNSGLETQATDAVFSASRSFFRESEAFKRQYLYRSAAENFGYQGLGMESLHPGRPGDLKETFTMRLNPQVPLADERFPSPAFRATIESFYRDCLTASQRILGVMAEVFGLAEDYFYSTVGGENVALRLLHYPSGQTPPDANHLGAGAHTDYGILTLLFQDRVSGLEVRDSDGTWQAVPCEPETVVINTGDMMAHWTNNRFRSTEHRVQPMTGDQDRFSVAFFVDPDTDTLIDVLPQCIDSQNPARFEPITAGEHIRRKLERSHNL